MTEKLKPCPFCGGKARFSGGWRVHVECTNCLVKTENFDNDGIPEMVWNTRANGQENLDGSSGDKTSPDEGYTYFVSFDWNNGKQRGLGDCVIGNCDEKNINAGLIERIKGILEERGCGNIVILNVIKLEW